jgi:hypothetical protein
MDSEVEYEDFERLQDRLNEELPALGERLVAEGFKLDEAQLKKAMLDWVYLNTDTDWLAMAAKDDEGFGDYGHGDLREFLKLATKAFTDAWGNRGRSPIDTLLEQIEDLIYDFREREDKTCQEPK